MIPVTEAKSKKIEELKTTDFDNTHDDNDIALPGYMLLIDEPEIALHPNGIRAASKYLYELAKEAKLIYGYDMCLMVGNVANPKTFQEYCKIGVDMVRIGIGNGGGCLTTVQTGVGYPMASLIQECYEIKSLSNYKTEIVADGGFKKFSDIIKGLAFGADYVMLGSILNQCLESSGETTKENYEVINQFSEDAKNMFHAETPLFKTLEKLLLMRVSKPQMN